MLCYIVANQSQPDAGYQRTSVTNKKAMETNLSGHFECFSGYISLLKWFQRKSEFSFRSENQKTININIQLCYLITFCGDRICFDR